MCILTHRRADLTRRRLNMQEVPRPKKKHEEYPLFTPDVRGGTVTIHGRTLGDVEKVRSPAVDGRRDRRSSRSR